MAIRLEDAFDPGLARPVSSAVPSGAPDTRQARSVTLATPAVSLTEFAQCTVASGGSGDGGGLGENGGGEGGGGGGGGA